MNWQGSSLHTMMSIFSPQVIHDGSHTVPVRANAGTDGIHALHGGPDGHLGAGTGFPGDVADLHLAVGNFGTLQLEQALTRLGWVRETWTRGPGRLRTSST